MTANNPLLTPIYFYSAKQIAVYLQETYANRKLYFLVDENTHAHCLTQIMVQGNSWLQDAEILEVEPGEESKQLEIAAQLYLALLESGADRKAVLVNVGGGMISDLGGYIAATFKRGISFVHVPTSLLGMVDASIGGKVGINLAEHKNQIGAFAKPDCILVNTDFLDTLPTRELMAGFAEMLKHSLIQGEQNFAELIETHPVQQSNWRKLVEQSMQFKQSIVRVDPNEANERKILNFGHTFGHAIESIFMHSNEPLLHGEAVAQGLLFELFLSKELCNFSSDFLNKAVQYLTTNYPKLNLDISHVEALWHYMQFDKKNAQSEVVAALLSANGKYETQVKLSKQQVELALDWYAKLSH